MIAYEYGYAKIVEILLEKNAITELKNKRGLTALALAKGYQYQNCVNMIKQYNKQHSSCAIL